MVEPRLCPLCATENFLLLSSPEGAPPPIGGDAPLFGGEVSVFSCNAGHVLLLIKGVNNSSQPSSCREIYIVSNGLGKEVACEKWFGASRESVDESFPPWRFAIALEAISDAVATLQGVVNSVWEHSLAGMAAEEIAECEMAKADQRSDEE
jgi:hypothetical protein